MEKVKKAKSKSQGQVARVPASEIVLPSKLRFPCKLSLQFVSTQHKSLLPRTLLNQWIKAALVGTGLFTEAQLTLRFVDVEEGQILNRDYRGKDYATNVLTFPYTPVGEPLLFADIVLCSAVVEQEAQAQNKSLLAHYAHLVVHGVLHAQGYDHEHAKEAEAMEALEVKLLAYLGFANPY